MQPSFIPDPMTPRLQSAMASADWSLLVRLCRQALRKNSRHLTAHRLLGFALHRKQDTEGAIAAYRQGAALLPQDAELLINYANVLLELARHQPALALLETVVQLRPNHSVCWSKLAQSCYALGLHQKGFDASQRALESATDNTQRVAALTQSAIHRRELGEVRQAVMDCEEAIRLSPFDPAGHTNRMLFMLADPSYGAKDMLEGAKTYAKTFEDPVRATWPDFAQLVRDPWRKLRVGFISPDFRHHAVMYFIEGLFTQLDRSQFEVFAFYLYPSEDTATERIRCHADHFIRLDGKTAREQAVAIQTEGIDVLIDLAGHTGHNGLLAMVHKPAPVQVSTIGYPGTTGLSAMDWWISDDVTDPPGADRFYVERLYRLPTRWTCYRPMSRNPLWRYQPAYQVTPTPALAKGYITFGSCNNLGKLTDEVLTLWGRILEAVPNARLLIEGKNLGNADTALSYRERCARLGVDTERLILVALDGGNQYLTYHRIDIALDPFPLVGGTTSNDLLWMGVPLVTMDGDSLRSRMGVGSLAYLGRNEWIARDQDEYLRIAANLASDVDVLNQTRLGLREETESSVLMREDVFVAEFGHALRKMWMHWLAESAHPDWTAKQVDVQVNEWLRKRPADREPSTEFHVGVAPGERIPLRLAYERLQTLLDKAKQGLQPTAGVPSNVLSNPNWQATTALAERILCAKPHDPVALTVLAEIENAHGHLEFGRVYLEQAIRSLADPEPAEQLLARTREYVKQALEHLANSPQSSQSEAR
ncbi:MULTISPECIES: tetratricopeptide repeat protein [unclassified Acidovorax]|uniref:O-linked N-acetylglucosamine transferase, SPINDLY family protein n=1 Tax=unclassified Acidovorax TaxID=2684926 RepID=UPI000C19DBF1|nr:MULTISPECIES: tetratricopeptide repeat protein [unclassified Acidovorax]